MSIYKKYQEYAISIVGRKNGYITQAEREDIVRDNFLLSFRTINKTRKI